MSDALAAELELRQLTANGSGDGAILVSAWKVIALIAALDTDREANESRLRIISQLQTERAELLAENEKLRASLHNRDVVLEAYRIDTETMQRLPIAALHPMYDAATPDLDPIREWLNTDPGDDPVETQLKQAIGHLRTLFTAIDDRDTAVARITARAALHPPIADGDTAQVEAIRARIPYAAADRTVASDDATILLALLDTARAYIAELDAERPTLTDAERAQVNEVRDEMALNRSIFDEQVHWLLDIIARLTHAPDGTGTEDA